ncbi:hypothetical protein ONS96_004818 [Cadophora gregata f. sp. sojae]|nr:hypothetical protein ONS96_004818 [Cadophora gregata f. sp. sojae]
MEDAKALTAHRRWICPQIKAFDPGVKDNESSVEGSSICASDLPAIEVILQSCALATFPPYRFLDPYSLPEHQIRTQNYSISPPKLWSYTQAHPPKQATPLPFDKARTGYRSCPPPNTLPLSRSVFRDTCRHSVVHFHSKARVNIDEAKVLPLDYSILPYKSTYGRNPESQISGFQKSQVDFATLVSAFITLGHADIPRTGSHESSSTIVDCRIGDWSRLN